MTKILDLLLYGMIKMSEKVGTRFAFRLFAFLLFLNITGLLLFINRELLKRRLNSISDDGYLFLTGSLLSVLLTFIFYKRRNQIIENYQYKDKSSLIVPVLCYSGLSLLFFVIIATRQI
ncbi:hypothetical protein [Mucilaginibacter sp.]|uniref:hypothetical protein n=1 Tax=Mucilaginibacter sp. TaxID=1882438 RepID=UPI003AFFC7B9